MDGSASAAVSRPGCRVERRVTRVSWRAMVLAVVLLAAGFAGGVYYMGSIPAADKFGDMVEYDLWAGLLGGVLGVALATSVFFVVWLRALAGLGGHRASRRAIAGSLGIALAALGVILAGLITTSARATASIGTSLARGTRPITIIAGLCVIPGLASFLMIRRIAGDERHWQESARCRRPCLAALARRASPVTGNARCIPDAVGRHHRDAAADVARV